MAVEKAITFDDLQKGDDDERRERFKKAVLKEEDRDEWAQLKALELELNLKVQVVLKEKDQLEAHQ